jgi:hypothetical protein
MRSGLIVSRILMSVLVPVVLLIGITMTLGDDPSRLGLSPGEFGQMSLLFSITMGFTVIAGLCGRYVLLVAAFYFPMMVGLLVGLALAVPFVFHSDVP